MAGNMRARNTTGTPVYQRQHGRGQLTLPQLNAVDLLAAGKTDKETAELLNLHRTSITKWRIYDPTFQAALNRRRVEVWSVGVDRLRSLIPKALDVLGQELDGPAGPTRLKAAAEVLRLVPLSANVLAFGLTDPEEIVRREVTTRRNRAPGPLDNLYDDGKGLPPMEAHMEQVWGELAALSNAQDTPGESGETVPR